jgi:hypothetical protein
MSIEENDEESPEPQGRVVMDEPPIHVPPESAWEFRIPVILLAVGSVALLGSAIASVAGGLSALKVQSDWVMTTYLAATMVFGFVLLVLVEVAVTIAMMYVLAAVLGISYGLLGSAVLKLAAINVFLPALWLMGTYAGHPILTSFALVPLSWYLFSSLFDLDYWETLVSVGAFPLLLMAFDKVIELLLGGAVGWLRLFS